MAKAAVKDTEAPEDGKARRKNPAGLLLWLMTAIVGAAFFAQTQSRPAGTGA